MKTEKKTEEVTKKAYEALRNFIELSKTLFSHAENDDDSAKLVNELIDKDSSFYKDAVAIAKDCEMDWKNLSPEDSDELQLILLEDYYNRIRVDKDFKYGLTIHVQKLEGGE